MLTLAAAMAVVTAYGLSSRELRHARWPVANRLIDLSAYRCRKPNTTGCSTVSPPQLNCVRWSGCADNESRKYLRRAFGREITYSEEFAL